MTSTNVYYNATISNLSNQIIGTSTYEEIRTEPLLNHSNMYNLSVLRLNADLSACPLLFFENSVYGITMEYSLTTSANSATFINYSYAASGPYPAIDPEIDNTPINRNYYKFLNKQPIFSYQHFIKLVNRALNYCYDNLSGAPAGGCPQMIYDPESSKFSIAYPDAYVNLWDVTQAGHINLYFNSALFSYFLFFEFKLTSSVNQYQLMFYKQPEDLNKRLIIGTANYYWILEQEIVALYLFNTAVKKVVLLTNDMPIRYEFQSDPLGKPIYQNILTDFEALFDNNSNIRSGISYVPSAEFKRTNIVSDKDLRKFSFTLKFFDIEGTLWDIPLFGGRTHTIKLLFEKKQ